MLHNSEKDFIKRHIGPSEDDQSKMLKKLNNSINEKDFIKKVITLDEKKEMDLKTAQKIFGNFDIITFFFKIF